MTEDTTTEKIQQISPDDGIASADDAEPVDVKPVCVVPIDAKPAEVVEGAVEVTDDGVEAGSVDADSVDSVNTEMVKSVNADVETVEPDVVETVEPDVVETVEPDVVETVEKVETVDNPAKVMRVGTMLKSLLKQVRSMKLDSDSKKRLNDIYELSVAEVGSVLSADLREELDRLTSPFKKSSPASAVELQIAKAQLVGWLVGLIRGIQAMLFAQELSARRHLDTMRTELMPSSAATFTVSDAQPPQNRTDSGGHTGAYL